MVLAAVCSKAVVLLLLLLILWLSVDPTVGFCNCSMFCCALLYVHSSFAIISMGKRELAALLCLSSWCLVIVVWPFLAMPRVCLQSVNMAFPNHTHLLFSIFFAHQETSISVRMVLLVFLYGERKIIVNKRD